MKFNVAALLKLVEGQTAGSPSSRRKWVRTSLRQLQRALRQQGFVCSHTTIGRLLRMYLRASSRDQ